MILTVIIIKFNSSRKNLNLILKIKSKLFHTIIKKRKQIIIPLKKIISLKRISHPNIKIK
jgi:hypothetical protein